jgi:glycine hydroxymethyltransferase
MTDYRAALKATDPEIYETLIGEEKRQREGVEMIPSENYTYPEVLAALGSVLTNKYSEGYPGRRYYGGTEFVDVIENLARDRAKALFRAEHANVQPLSGSPMNQAVYLGFIEPGATILAMELSHGGHLTHGAPVSHMGKIYRFVRYKTNPQDGSIDFDQLRDVALKEKPKLVVCGYSSYPRDYDYKPFRQIADEVGALTMADVSHIGGLIAGGAMRNPMDAGFDFLTTTTHKSLRGPRGGLMLWNDEALTKKFNSAVFPGLQGGPLMHVIAAKAVAFAEALHPDFKIYARNVVENAKALAESLRAQGFDIVSGGTDNHLMLVDLRPKGLKGNVSEKALVRAAITCNKNGIPFDPETPFVTSGLRLGTPAATTRGFGVAEFKQVGMLISEVLNAIAQSSDGKAPMVEAAIKERVKALTDRFPIYQ